MAIRGAGARARRRQGPSLTWHELLHPSLSRGARSALSFHCAFNRFFRTGERKHTPPMQASDHARRIELNPPKRPGLSRPKEFVRLVSVQKVVLNRALFDCFLNGQANHDESDALAHKCLVESRLVETIFIVIPKPIESGNRTSIDC